MQKLEHKQQPKCDKLQRNTKKKNEREKILDERTRTSKDPNATRRKLRTILFTRNEALTDDFLLYFFFLFFFSLWEMLCSYSMNFLNYEEFEYEEWKRERDAEKKRGRERERETNSFLCWFSLCSLLFFRTILCIILLREQCDENSVENKTDFARECCCCCCYCLCTNRIGVFGFGFCDCCYDSGRLRARSTKFHYTLGGGGVCFRVFSKLFLLYFLFSSFPVSFHFNHSSLDCVFSSSLFYSVFLLLNKILRSEQ